MASGTIKKGFIPFKTISDLNAIPFAEVNNIMFYRTNSNSTNTPYTAGITTASDGIALSYIATGGTAGFQLYLAIGEAKICFRALASGVWGSWKTATLT